MSKDENKKSCKKCRWWGGSDKGEGRRSCARFPPVFVGETGYEGCFEGIFPETYSDTFCGEYKEQLGPPQS